MGITAVLSVGHFEITETKHGIRPEILFLFQPSDLQINNEANTARLIISSDKLLHRLDISGFTKKKTCSAFYSGLTTLISDFKSYLEYDEHISSTDKKRIKFLDNLKETFQ